MRENASQCMRVLAAVVLTSSGCAGAAEQRGPVALSEAIKAPDKFDGQKACWIGHQMASSYSTDAQGRSERTTTWMALDEKQNIVPDLTFVAIEDGAKRTEAAAKADSTSGDRGDRSVCGTIKGSREVTMQVGGESRKVRVPILTDITKDVLPLPQK